MVFILVIDNVCHLPDLIAIFRVAIAMSLRHLIDNLYWLLRINHSSTPCLVQGIVFKEFLGLDPLHETFIGSFKSIFFSIGFFCYPFSKLGSVHKVISNLLIVWLFNPVEE